MRKIQKKLMFFNYDTELIVAYPVHRFPGQGLQIFFTNK